jgi:hypothetical protein
LLASLSSVPFHFSDVIEPSLFCTTKVSPAPLATVKLALPFVTPNADEPPALD